MGVYERNLWYRTRREEEVRRRGSRCERCGIRTGPFEFHHRKPTGLAGRSRGQNHRVLDLIKNPKAYAMLCVPCHHAVHALIIEEAL